ncbi:pilus assembly protein PilM, partial [candidate division WWE3 bacterium]|nr:pilus assembly protein PilM [candidate division WWE3 bacterium]
MNVIGLDIGIHSIKAVEVKKDKGKNELVKFGLGESLNLNLSSDREEEMTKYARALSDFFDEHGFSTPRINVGLPETDVFTRVIKVPKMSDKELKSSIKFEAEQYIPLPLKEVNFDFQVLKDDTVGKNNMSVLLVAAKKTLIEKYVKI